MNGHCQNQYLYQGGLRRVENKGMGEDISSSSLQDRFPSLSKFDEKMLGMRE